MYLTPPGDAESPESGKSRRSFIKGVSAAGLTAAVTSLAGCSGGDPTQNREKVQKLTFAGYPPSNKNAHGTLTTACEHVRELGFDIEYKGLKRERQLQLGYFEQDYDLFSGGYGGRPHRLDPHMLLYKNHHSSQTNDGNYNWTNYQNDEIDSLLDEQARTLDTNKRQGIIKEIQKKLMDDPPGEMPIQHDSVINVTNTADFEGYATVPGIGLKNIWTWTQVKPKTDKTQLTASVNMEVPWITPLWSNEANLITQRMVHDKLARIDEEGLPTPWLAKEWTTSDDNTTITVPLREDFTFHDGESVTAEDVKFTFDYLQEQEVPFFKSAVAPIESVEAPDDYNIKVNLTEPFAPIFTLTFSRVHILPKHIWENIPQEVDVEQPWKWSPTESEYGLVGSGPFKFKEWQKGEGIHLEANSEHPVAAPNVDSVFLRVVSSSSGITAGLKNKDIDFSVRSSAQASVLDNLASNEDHLTFTATPSVGYDEWSMNTARSPFDSSAVRGAMSAMIPKEVIAKEIWDGYAIPAHSPTSPVLDFWYNEDVKKWPDVSKEEAITMLEDEGFLVADDGVYYPEDYTPTQNDPDK